MSAQVPKGVSFFRKLDFKIRNKSRDKRKRRDVDEHTSQLQLVDQPAGDKGQIIDQFTGRENNPGISQLQASRPLQPGDHSFGDEDHPSVPLAPSTTSEPQALGDDARNREAAQDSKPSILTVSPSIDHSRMEKKNEDNHGIPIQIETSITSENPSIHRGDMQNREAGYGVDSIPNAAPMVDSAVQRKPEDALSNSFFSGSSNVNITGANFYEVHGDATIIRFGDGQFTDIQKNLICNYIANLAVLPNINNNLKQHVLTQSIISLPRAEAVFNDYQTKKKSGPCFGGTRMALLREMADWVTLIDPDESRMYVLSGLAGIGKSTVAYTIASRASDLNLLGASFFFSRDEADRNNAKKFFTTIAYQLCVYHETFAKAIGDVLKTERGSAAATKDPQVQLKTLILDPLRSMVQSRSRPILIVVDALDECDDEDAFSVLSGLSQLVRSLPSFKVILTTRPQLYLDAFLGSQGGHNILCLQDIEDKVVDGDIRLYLKHSLSLELVQKRYPKRQWCASDQEIHALVHAAGRLFIIASTAVRYILDKAASNPAAQMQKLLRASAQDHTPFKDLNQFYTVILRNAVPDNCDDGIVNRYQSVIGAIILVQRPLPVSTLAQLINIDVDNIRSVLDNLQSVILLGSDDVPRVYHKSFPDYLTDRGRCKDSRLLIDTKTQHTQIGICCFEIMEKHLKRNILGLGDPARFMSNEDGLEEDEITEEQLQEKIPQHLQYTCVYWANHLEVANVEHAGLMNGLSTFADERILYWIEVLSLIGNLDSAHRAVRVVLKLLKSTSSDLYELLLDALRFISKFYKLIERSALHTYHSALPFTPSNSLFYRRYIEEASHNMCGIEDGPEKWETLVANLSHEEHVEDIKFSLDNTLFVSCSKDHGRNKSGNLKIWDAATGILISTIPGCTLVVANDFSTIASSEDNDIMYYNVNGSTRGTMFTTSSKIQKLAISSESHRIAAGLSDGTVQLWDSESTKLIKNFDGFQCNGRFQFSPTGSKLAYSSANGVVKLQDGVSGRFIADVRCRSADRYFEFSGDGSRIVSVSSGYSSATLWNGESGGLIGAVTDVGGHGLAISANGSLLATTDFLGQKVKLWSENHDKLVQIKILELDKLQLMAFSLDNILAIATSDAIKLYNVTTHSFISTLPFGGDPTALSFSPNSTRLTVGTKDGRLYLWDIKGLDVSGPSSKETTTITALALSRDCSQLAYGLVDGRVALWGTNPTKQRIVLSASRWIMDTVLFRNYRHPHQITALGFSPDGNLFASGSDDGTIKLWNSGDASLRGTVKVSGLLQAVAVSNGMLVVGCDYHVTMWSLDTLSLIHTSKESGGIVSIAENGAFIAVTRDRGILLHDALNHTTIVTFDIPHEIHAMTFLPDNSQLVAQSYEDGFLSLNLANKHLIKGPTLEHLVHLPNTPLWHGVPISHCRDKMQHYFSALFSQHKSPVPVLWVPREISVTAWTQGSSMMAIGYEDGRVMLLRLHTSRDC